MAMHDGSISARMASIKQSIHADLSNAHQDAKQRAAYATQMFGPSAGTELMKEFARAAARLDPSFRARCEQYTTHFSTYHPSPSPNQPYPRTYTLRQVQDNQFPTNNYGESTPHQERSMHHQPTAQSDHQSPHHQQQQQHDTPAAARNESTRTATRNRPVAVSPSAPSPSCDDAEPQEHRGHEADTEPQAATASTVTEERSSASANPPRSPSGDLRLQHPRRVTSQFIIGRHLISSIVTVETYEQTHKAIPTTQANLGFDLTAVLAKGAEWEQGKFERDCEQHYSVLKKQSPALYTRPKFFFGKRSLEYLLTRARDLLTAAAETARVTFVVVDVAGGLVRQFGLDEERRKIFIGITKKGYCNLTSSLTQDRTTNASSSGESDAHRGRRHAAARPGTDPSESTRTLTLAPPHTAAPWLGHYKYGTTSIVAIDVFEKTIGEVPRVQGRQDKNLLKTISRMLGIDHRDLRDRAEFEFDKMRRRDRWFTKTAALELTGPVLTDPQRHIDVFFAFSKATGFGFNIVDLRNNTIRRVSPRSNQGQLFLGFDDWGFCQLTAARVAKEVDKIRVRRENAPSPTSSVLGLSDSEDAEKSPTRTSPPPSPPTSPTSRKNSKSTSSDGAEINFLKDPARGEVIQESPENEGTGEEQAAAEQVDEVNTEDEWSSAKTVEEEEVTRERGETTSATQIQERKPRGPVTRSKSATETLTIRVETNISKTDLSEYFSKRDMPPDGYCFYHALLRHLTQTRQEYATLTIKSLLRTIHDYILANTDVYASLKDKYFLEDNRDGKTELRRLAIFHQMPKLKEAVDFADELDMALAAACFDTAFALVMARGEAYQVAYVVGDITATGDYHIPYFLYANHHVDGLEPRPGKSIVFVSTDKNAPVHVRAGGCPDPAQTTSASAPTTPLTRRPSARVQAPDMIFPAIASPSPPRTQSANDEPVTSVSRSRPVMVARSESPEPVIPVPARDFFVAGAPTIRVDNLLAGAVINQTLVRKWAMWTRGNHCPWPDCGASIVSEDIRTHVVTHLRARENGKNEYASNIIAFLVGRDLSICTGPKDATLFQCSNVVPTTYASFTMRTPSLAEEESPSLKNYFHTCASCKKHDIENMAINPHDDPTRLAGQPIEPVTVVPASGDLDPMTFTIPETCTDARWEISASRVIDAALIAASNNFPRAGRETPDPANLRLYFSQLAAVKRAAAASAPGGTLALYTFTTVMTIVAHTLTVNDEALFLTHWVQRDFVAFTAPMFKIQARAQRSRSEAPPVRTDRVAKERKLKRTLRDKGAGAAAATLDRPGIAPDSPTLIDLIRELHPSAPAPAVPEPDRLIKPDEMNLDQLRRVIFSLAPSAAEGFGALSARVLRTMVADPAHRDCAVACLSLINAILAGRLSDSAMDLHLACIMIPALKKDADVTTARDLRPICVLSPLIKIPASFLAEKYASKFAETLGPRQLGTGTRGGIEIIAHTVQLMMTWAYKNKKPFVALNLDASNAYGMCDRAEALKQFLTHAPGAFAYIAAAYGRVNVAYMNGQRVEISQGARQGDPLSSYFYALSINSALQQLATEFSDARILSFVDDIIILAEPEVAYKLVARFHVLASPLGYKINIRKTVIAENPAARADPAIHRAGIASLSELLDQPQGFACVTEDANGALSFPSGLTATGIPCFFHDPLRPSREATEAITERIRTATEKLDKVGTIGDRQAAVAILNVARNIGLVNHLLRGVHPAMWTQQKHRNLLDSFDNKAFELFAQQILGDLHGDDTTFRRRDVCAVAAPIGNSGTAFRRASSIAACAWLSSVQQFFGPIMDLVTPMIGDAAVVRDLVEELAVPARDEYLSHCVEGVSNIRTELPDFTSYVWPSPLANATENKALSELQSRRSKRVDEANVKGRYAGMDENDESKKRLERNVASMRKNILFSIDGRYGGIELTNDEVSAICARDSHSIFTL